MGSASARRWPAWLGFGLWSALIAVSVPLVRPFQTWVAARFGSTLFAYGVLAAVAAALLLSTLLLHRLRRRLDVGSLLWLTGVAALFVGWTLRLWGRPEETVHFVEYGVLGYLAWLALRQHLPDAGVHLGATLLVGLVGLGDEVLQWVVPTRYFDLRDVVINTGAGALVQLALWKAAPPPVASIQTPSARLSLRLSALAAALLAVCMGITPPRVERLCDRFPSLGFLRTNPDVMAEYGHLIRDPAIGRFRSRFRADELQRLDRQRGAEAGATLDAYPDPRYGDFLAQFTPVSNPFLHEARVHLWSRDRNLEVATAATDPEVAREAATAAFRENQILEGYFGRTLASSRSAWSEAQSAGAAALVDPGLRFESKVGAQLITLLSERQLRAALLALLLVLIAAERRLGRREASP
jgi:hypothetical protein